MVLNTMLMSLLVAIFGMAGIQHLLVFARKSSAIDHAWFGIACVAAAAAALAMSPVYRMPLRRMRSCSSKCHGC